MKTFIVTLLLLFFVSCSKGASEERGHNGREEGNGYPALPDGSTYTDRDLAEMKDNRARFSARGIELRFGEPGILYTQSADKEQTSIRDLSNDGHLGTFSRKTRRFELDGEIIAYDAVEIQNDEQLGITWWRAYTKGDSTAVYFVTLDD
ncbi:MAG: hypothetical protein J1E99_05630 [Muribaculaceae bacterium]|nr:hypothetical protein [Muribaculaceae bacterium]